MDKYTGKIADSVFIAEGAQLSGTDINIGKHSNVWYNAVLRSSHSSIDIGENTNIQDNCVLHAEEGKPIHVGNGVTIGHSAIVHACTVGDNTLIGMGATVMTGCKVGNNCLIGAGALVTQGTVIPDGMMAFGSPARVRRPLTEEEIQGNRDSAEEYVQEAAEHLK
ncbi:MAG: gamma carbonic anhydrase family protein [Eubacterium sp.]|nr:gamma carbonic anhydrase family protein [Eubacterium sp.]MCH4046522.1 gamma carbonic anhydrase family protein [Eubacterium sp.]MCH4079617.1 gamma carbonic anhydrase family protein [Eubacterium sp.]MCH4110176.1 gamma carbonic anhydrase family protein [Eubacterium sp.]MCI1307438.1 gamma carbonic anhydrase family protein [Eubacterium sp.]